MYRTGQTTIAKWNWDGSIRGSDQYSSCRKRARATVSTDIRTNGIAKGGEGYKGK